MSDHEVDGTPWGLACPPRFGTQRTWDRPTLGPRVEETARKLLGHSLMPAQRYIADVAGEVDEHGELVYDTVVILKGRQSGKTYLSLPVIAHRMVGFGSSQNAVFTMQTADKARLRWRNVHVPAIRNSELGSYIADVRYQRNFEQMFFANGSTYFPITPSGKSGATGDTIDLAFLDEGWALDDGVEQSVSPAMVTRFSPQMWITSTAKRQEEGKPRNPHFAAWFRNKVRAGRAQVMAGVNSGAAYFEWSALPGTDPLDPTTWWASIPSLGYTQREKAIEAQARRMRLEDFAAEFLGIWDDDNELTWIVIAESDWKRAATREVAPRAPLAFGVDVMPDRNVAAIVSAGPDGHGGWAIELVDCRRGTGWVLDRVGELIEKWNPCGVAYARNGASAALFKGAAETWPLKPATVQDSAAGYGLVMDYLNDGLLRQAMQPEMTAAAAAVGKRKLGGTWTWDWQSPVNISPIVAAGLGLWSAREHGPAWVNDRYDVLKSVL